MGKVEGRKLNIAMFCAHSHPMGNLGTKDTGGMSVYICKVALELGKCGHSVDIFTRFNGVYNKKVINLGHNVRLIQIKAGKNNALNKRALYLHLDEFMKGVDSFRIQSDITYDIIHSHYWLSGIAGLWARNSWSKPHVTTFHTVSAIRKEVAPDSHISRFRFNHEKKLMDECDLVVSSTEFEKQDIIRLYGCRTSKIRVIHCGVDLDIFFPVDKKKARKALGLSGNDVILLYVGRIDPMKRVDRLLGAATLLKQKGGCRVIIIGGDETPGEEECRLIKMTQDLNIENCVIFPGCLPQHQLLVYYSAADVFVFPSRYESFGLAGLEAMACGIPVVATDVGVYSQLLRENFNCGLISDSHPELMVKKIEKILALGKIKGDQTEDIRNIARQYTWAKTAESLSSAYLDLVQSTKD